MNERFLTVYTIGYGNRDLETFIRLLEQYQVRFLIDVRSKPYSRFNQPFNKESLQTSLELNKIRYVFMGDQLGGRPDDPSCYAENGKVRYDILKTKSFFQEGIQRIQRAVEQKLSVAIMCSELRPQECHRSKLIGTALRELDIDVCHIDEDGNLKTQVQIIEMLTKPQQMSFFSDLNPEDKTLTSRKSYKSNIAEPRNDE